MRVATRTCLLLPLFLACALSTSGEKVMDDSERTTIVKPATPEAESHLGFDFRDFSPLNYLFGEEKAEEVRRGMDDEEVDAVIEEAGEKRPAVGGRRAKRRMKRQPGCKTESYGSAYSYNQPPPPDVVDDLARYMSSCDDCLVEHDKFQCPLHEQALELKKWISELQNLLSFGCQIADECRRTDGKCCHSDDPMFGRIISDMTDTARRMYDTFQAACADCPVDGEWGQWCEWSDCSESCGTGRRMRTRRCDSPAARGNGKPCPGSSVDSEPCTGMIPMDGNWNSWSTWSTCSDSCGLGMQERRRDCVNPPANACGRICPGPVNDVRPCEDVDYDAGWSEWECWSECSESCGGTRQRRRTCTNKCGRNCEGPDLDIDSETCECVPYIPPCEPRTWTEWGPWSPCSTTCGEGSRERLRTCYSNTPCVYETEDSCPGPAVDIDRCVENPIVNGNWSPWESWAQCSVTCGGGARERRRRCNNPPPNICGTRCPGYAFDTETCAEQNCCNWATWQPWSPCDTTCGFGSRSRQRECIETGSEIGYGRGLRCDPRNCPGQGAEVESCQLPTCPPPRWDEWGNWCPCDCRQGMRSRRRKCLKEGVEVDIGMCFKIYAGVVAREEESCDVRDSCPECLRPDRCSGKEDGLYPSCTSCSDYVRCTNGRAELLRCQNSNDGRYEWDHFIQKCIPPKNSTSCTLIDCISPSSCRIDDDKKYPSCRGCTSYVDCSTGRERLCNAREEFNYHLQKCEFGESPTCKVPSRDSFDFMARDAPADSYIAGEEQMTNTDRQQVYINLRVRVGEAAKYNRTDEDFTTLRESKGGQGMEGPHAVEVTGDEEKGRMDTDGSRLDVATAAVHKPSPAAKKRPPSSAPNADEESQGPAVMPGRPEWSCHKDCKGLEPGAYQSCRGCNFYLLCTRNGVTRELLCRRNRVWDDGKKRCKRRSRTCKTNNLKNMVRP